MPPLLSFTLSVILLAFFLYFLVIAQDLLIPFVIAIVLWYLLLSLTEGLRKIGLRKFALPYPLALVVSLFLLLATLWGVFALISANVSAFLAEAPLYQQKLIELINTVLAGVGIDDPEYLYKGFKDFDFVNLLTGVVAMLTDVAGNMGLILIYVLFLLLEHHTFDRKLQIITKEKYLQSRDVIDRIGEKIQSYIRIKTLMSLLTGFTSFLILKGFSVDFANFWAFLIFLLNYIPTIGSIMATLFPFLFSLIQFGHWVPSFALLLCLTAVQFSIGNLLEPRVMGRSFNLSPLVILLSLALWGKLWGIVGMFLCVPITVILVIILGSFSETHSIALLLSAQGEAEEK